MVFTVSASASLLCFDNMHGVAKAESFSTFHYRISTLATLKLDLYCYWTRAIVQFVVKGKVADRRYVTPARSSELANRELSKCSVSDYTS